MALTQAERAEQRGRGRRILAWTLLVLVLLVAALWLLWGFRWPPTAEVVEDPPEVSRLVPGFGASAAPGDPGVDVG